MLPTWSLVVCFFLFVCFVDIKTKIPKTFPIRTPPWHSTPWWSLESTQVQRWSCWVAPSNSMASTWCWKHFPNESVPAWHGFFPGFGSSQLLGWSKLKSMLEKFVEVEVQWSWWKKASFDRLKKTRLFISNWRKHHIKKAHAKSWLNKCQ